MSPSVALSVKRWIIFIHSTVIFSCGLYVASLCSISYSGQHKINNYHAISYDPYFGKIINILHILKGGCKLLTSTVQRLSGDSDWLQKAHAVAWFTETQV